jgi:hypothetical protein
MIANWPEQERIDTGRAWTYGLGSIPGRGKIYLNKVQTGSGAHPASYLVGNRGSFPGGKVAGAWSWPLHLVQRSKVVEQSV